MSTTDTTPLPFHDRLVLAVDQLRIREKERPDGTLTDGDIMDAADAWTTSVEPPEDAHPAHSDVWYAAMDDHQRLTEALFLFVDGDV